MPNTKKSQGHEHDASKKSMEDEKKGGKSNLRKGENESRGGSSNSNRETSGNR